MVGECLAKGIEAVVGDAQRLPFRDGSYDLVYCSFLLLWARDPEAVVREMARVSRGWVVCLAEPDYLARVDHPEALSELTVLIAQGAREAGADPAMGRRLRSLFCRNGMRAEVGVIPGIWPLEREAAEMEAEWSWSRSMLPASTPGPTVQRLRRSWEGALRDGTLLRFNPAFYAIARRPQTEERASRQR
jgi:SAM-dependent methyltransferase